MKYTFILRKKLFLWLRCGKNVLLDLYLCRKSAQNEAN